MELHIIYTELCVFISKKPYTCWQEIQNEFYDYKASLGPWPEDEVIEYLTDEYLNLKPSASDQVIEFIREETEIFELSFAESEKTFDRKISEKNNSFENLFVKFKKIFLKK